MSSAVDDLAALPVSGPAGRLARWLLRRLARGIEVGALHVVLPDGTRFDHRGSRPGMAASLVLHRWRVLRRVLLGGHVAFGEAFVDGDWSSPDLVGLLALASANEAALTRAANGVGAQLLIDRLRHRLRRNTRRGSRRNIVAHYDLGNDFYRLWLDRGMNYSSALYRHPDDSLEAAQLAKQQRVLDLLRLAGGERVLEIGCGWGALAIALGERGCRVTALTLSPAQRAFAAGRAAAAGLGHQVEPRLEDYRDVAGTFDRVVSIEMLEAVGEAYWPLYFARLRALLRPGGTAVLQVITIAEDRFEGYRRRPDFIQRHVFPGGMLPSPGVVRAQVAAAGLGLERVETFGASYAETLKHWRARFAASRGAVEALGHSAGFCRLWDYYLAYCEAGFRAGAIDVGLWQLSG